MKVMYLVKVNGSTVMETSNRAQAHAERRSYLQVQGRTVKVYKDQVTDENSDAFISEVSH